MISIYLLAFVTSLESQTTTNLTVYATSAFAEHSLVATVQVVQGVVNGTLFSLVHPPLLGLLYAINLVISLNLSDMY